MTLISRLVFFPAKKTQKKSSSSIKTDEISIVIPVKDNQRGIENYLRNFFASHQPFQYPKEIIVVDNNSNIPIKIPDRFSASGITKLVKCSKIGPAAARNYGATVAQGEWLLFNDSDCIPTSSLLSGYAKADNGSVAYAGNVNSLGQDNLSRYYESQEILIPLKTYNEHGEFVPQYLITANSLIWNEAFKEARGFNEEIQIAGGEDVDLGLRLSQIGNLSYAFDSIALHDFNDGLLGFYKRFKRYGYGNRIIQELYNTNMKPQLFKPNKRTLFNSAAAKLQYLFLSIGYSQANRHIKLKVNQMKLNN